MGFLDYLEKQQKKTKKTKTIVKPKVDHFTKKDEPTKIVETISSRAVNILDGVEEMNKSIAPTQTVAMDRSSLSQNMSRASSILD